MSLLGPFWLSSQCNLGSCNTMGVVTLDIALLSQGPNPLPSHIALRIEVITAYITMPDLVLLVGLLLHHGLELRERLKHLQFLPEEIDPEVV
jgi:hypothetical protein